MHFIDDIDLMRTERWREIDGFAQFSDIVDAGMLSRIDFDDVERATFGHEEAVLAFVAGLRQRKALARFAGA